MIMDVKYVTLTQTEDSGEQHDIIFNNAKIKKWNESPIKEKGKVIGRRLELDISSKVDDLDIVEREIPYEQVLEKKYLDPKKNYEEIYKDAHSSLLKIAESQSKEINTLENMYDNAKRVIVKMREHIDIIEKQIPKEKTGKEDVECAIFWGVLLSLAVFGILHILCILGVLHIVY